MLRQIMCMVQTTFTPEKLSTQLNAELRNFLNMLNIFNLQNENLQIAS